MGAPFYGREREMALLRERLESKIASLIVIKGRRRIGKSRLAEEFSKPFKTFLIEGLPPDEEAITAQSQRTHFAKCLEKEAGVRGLKADDWDDLFWHLAEVTKRGRIIVILDEINWMGSKDPTFLGKLKTAWDKYLKKNPQLICILSGSLSGWIERNILSSTGFLGRVSLDLTLDELPLNECNHFWRPHEKRIAPFEKFKILSVTGGIPRYLEEIDPKISAEEMIYRLCFRREGLLFQEFDRIFSDLFSRRAPTYKKIVQRLAEGRGSLQQICDMLKMEKGGQISEYLTDLEETQYIQKHTTWSLKNGKTLKSSYYRLKDNYLRFYLKYIEPHAEAISKGSIRKTPAWDSIYRNNLKNREFGKEAPQNFDAERATIAEGQGASEHQNSEAKPTEPKPDSSGYFGIMGLQFENLVLNNFSRIHSLLNIWSEEILHDGPYFQRQTSTQKGCQIDYLILLKYNSLYLCEIKYSSKPIGLEVIQEVQEKMDRLTLPSAPVSLRPVLIHVNGVTPPLQASNFFTHVIDFSSFLT